jgi:hypothetical protein
MGLRSGGLAVVVAAGLAGGGAPSLASGAGGAAVLAPHRAVYDMVLDRTRAAGGISALTGRMVYELTGSPCEGFAQSMRFVMRTTTDDGTGSVNDMRSSSFEDASGNSFKFSSSQYKDDQLAEQVSGDAARENGGIKVELTRPTKSELKHAGKPMFPVQHSIALLEAARAGRTMFTTDLFDGSEKAEKVFATTAVIGRRMAPGFNRSLAAVKNSEPLDTLAAWPVSLSYFEAGRDKQDSVPTYELAFVFFENGVSRRLFIDYGDYSIKGDLKELTFLEAAKCEKK